MLRVNLGGLGRTWVRISGINGQVYPGGEISYVTILALQVDANGTVYVGTSNGIYKIASGSGAATAVGLVNETINAIAMDANGKLYTGGRNVFMSADGGAIWSKLTITGLNNPYISSLTVGVSGTLYAGNSGRVFQNKNITGDDSWMAVNSDLPGPAAIRAFATDSSGTLYAGTSADIADSSTLYKMVGNKKWMAASNGLPKKTISSLAIDKSDVIYAGTAIGIFKSITGGDTWTAANTGLTDTDITRLVVDNNGTLYAATYNGNVFKSIDGASTWKPTAFKNTNDRGISFNLAVDLNGIVYVTATNFGVYGSLWKSTDGGATWQAINKYFANSGIVALAVDANGVLYAGTSSEGIFKSTDGGGTWTAAQNGLSSRYISVLALDKNGVLYAGTPAGVRPSRMFRSIDSGDHWTEISNSLPDTGLNVISADAAGNLFAGTDNGVFQYTPPGANTSHFAISGKATGSSTEQKLSADITVAPADTDNIGNLYVVAYLPDSGAYVLSEKRWLPLIFSGLQPYSTAVLGTHTINLLGGSVDISALHGLEFYAGYGYDTSDMLGNGKYARIYTVR